MDCTANPLPTISRDRSIDFAVSSPCDEIDLPTSLLDTTRIDRSPMFDRQYVGSRCTSHICHMRAHQERTILQEHFRAGAQQCPPPGHLDSPLVAHRFADQGDRALRARDGTQVHDCPISRKQ